VELLCFIRHTMATAGYMSTAPRQAGGGRLPTKNVMFFAKTQEGKSTTIDELYELLCGQKPSAIKESQLVLGSGGESATKQVTLLNAVPVPTLKIAAYPTDESSKEYKEVKSKNMEIKELKEKSNDEMTPEIASRLFEIRHEIQLHDKTFKFNDAVEKAYDECTWMFRAIDTPGMNDSENRDDEFIENMIYTLADTRGGDLSSNQISACAFVVKSSSAFDSGWKESVKRYWDQFEDLRQLWMFIHTAVDPYHEYEEGQCYEQLCAMRRTAVVDAVVASVSKSDKDKELIQTFPHFFVDNKVGRKGSTSYQFRSWERARSFQQLLSLIELQKPISCSDLLYTKTPNQILVDRAVLSAINNAVGGYEQALASFKIEGGDLLGEISRAQTAINEQEGIINKANGTISAYDNRNRESITSDTQTQEWTFWGGTRNGEETYAKPFSSCRISVDSVGGFDSGSYEITGSDPWTVKFHSPWCRGYSFLVVVDVEKCDKYRDDILEARRNIETANKDIEDQKKLIKANEEKLAKNEETKEKMENLKAKMDYMSNWKTYVSPEKRKVRPEEWTVLKEFYKRYLDESASGIETNNMKAILEALAPRVMVATQKIDLKLATKEVKAMLEKHGI